MKKKLNARFYTNLALFMQDLHLIYSNCSLYNGHEHPFTEIAGSIIKVAEDLIEQVRLAWQQASVFFFS